MKELPPAARTVTGRLKTTGQKHFYIEAQTAMVWPAEKEKKAKQQRQRDRPHRG